VEALGGALIGTLLKFDYEKRKLYHPTAPRYPVFDQQVGLCTNYRINEHGDAYVRVQWLKPIQMAGRFTKESSFALDNFIVVGKVHGKK